VINNAIFLVMYQAAYELILAIFLHKPCKGTDSKIVKHASGTRKFRAFPTTVQLFISAASVMLTPFLILTTVVSAADTGSIFTAHRTDKSAISNLPIHYTNPFRYDFHMKVSEKTFYTIKKIL